MGLGKVAILSSSPAEGALAVWGREMVAGPKTTYFDRFDRKVEVENTPRSPGTVEMFQEVGQGVGAAGGTVWKVIGRCLGVLEFELGGVGVKNVIFRLVRPEVEELKNESRCPDTAKVVWEVGQGVEPTGGTTGSRQYSVVGGGTFWPEAPTL